MKNKGFSLIEVMIVVAILGLLIAMAIPACHAIRDSGKRDEATYSAWCKLNQRTDISFEEWRALRDSRMLPHQTTAKPQ